MFEPLETHRMILRGYRESDIPQMAARLQDLHHFHMTEAFALEQVHKDFAGGSSGRMAIGLFKRKDNATLIGEVQASRVGADTWSLNYHTRSAFAGQGYMREGLEALFPLFRDTLKAQFLRASVSDDTEAKEASIRLLENTGFVRGEYRRGSTIFCKTL